MVVGDGNIAVCIQPEPSEKSLDVEDDLEKNDCDGTDISQLTNEKLRKGWTDEPRATAFFVRLISFLYALIATILALVIEISPIWRNQLWLAESVFYLFMYGMGLVFFVYCYMFIIYPGGYNYAVRYLHKRHLIADDQDWLIIRSTHNGEGAGTLYLRLGVLFFGSVGIVLFGLELFLCAEKHDCRNVTIAKMVIAIIFTFIQMHFIFCNSKVVIGSSRKTATFGMMHLVAVNLWTWFRFVLAKQEAKAAKKAAYYEAKSSASSSSEEYIASTQVSEHLKAVSTTAEALLNETVAAAYDSNPTIRLYSLDEFGDVATFLSTCIIEYSLIGAAVMFILWKSIWSTSNLHHHQPESNGKRKQKMRIDCSASSTGLFAGIIFLICALVSMGMYTIFESLRNSNGAQMMFGIADLSLFSVGLVACCVGLWRMRLLQYRLHAHGEVIDEILLIIGLIGELVYCIIGIDVFIACRRTATEPSLLPAFVFAVRMIQVIVQSAFILITSRLRCLSLSAAKIKPGKEIITFLLVSNVTLFMFYTYEGMKSNFGFSSKAAYEYNYIIYAVAPLLVFYRFHSSACLAEIWKNTYSNKEIESLNHSLTISDSNLTVSTPIPEHAIASTPTNNNPED